ncbi:rRNA methylase [Hahella chejuensis KCTC 2396]|uniref:tRNA (cytidine/uridine-2'-O-)-methyltransferase TrmJ n=1 Tax=Hahella chejuensis (strain KCTC 2396) TaxID=349521 RepID=Q2SDV6_HAHCH|nr:tRNA (cytosine(32)/uridine(32)-2'-O)-methyltransferase TrmJ [Hahella chejuensis]ABC31168.1 rRNA methylase [Hahella chejuensis KCTC 2396]
MLENVRIVLVNTSHPGNIGATARVMKNMRLSRLVLVEPDRFPDDDATSRASGALDVLGSAQVVASLEEAIDGCVLVVGTSARGRSIPWPVRNPRDLADDVYDRVATTRGDVAIVFGREERGLTNDELQRCHLHVHIPSNPDYSSLNVAMAAQVICYELHMRWLLENEENQSYIQRLDGPGDAGWDVEAATADEIERYLAHLEQTLVDIEFHDPENPRQLMSRLRRLYQRARLDKMEINILRGILRSTQKMAGTWQKK